MKNETSQTEGGRFRVVCVWCGDVIRRDRNKDSRGTCPRCFERMLAEHAARSHAREGAERLRASSR